MATLANLRAACAAGLVLDLDQFHINRYLIVAVTPCAGDGCPNRRDGLTCAGVVDLQLVGNPAVPVDRCHVATSYTLPTVPADLPAAA